MENKAKCDFELIAYEKLLKIFPFYVKTTRTIPTREIYRRFGFLYSLTEDRQDFVLELWLIGLKGWK